MKTIVIPQLALGLVAAVIVDCAGWHADPGPAQAEEEARSHEVRCGDMTRLQFYWRKPSTRQPIGEAVSPWRRSDLVWLGDSTGLDGSEIESLRVVEKPRHQFVKVDERLGRIPVPGSFASVLEVTFTPTGGMRFLEIERTLCEERQRDLLGARGLAILLDGELFLAPSTLCADLGPESPVLRLIGLPEGRFDEAVAMLEEGLRC